MTVEIIVSIIFLIVGIACLCNSFYRQGYHKGVHDMLKKGIEQHIEHHDQIIKELEHLQQLTKGGNEDGVQ